MKVLFVSQCMKNALTETRRILDNFAERCGDRVWQTHITKQGLDTVRQLLKSSARRNTAVACYWIRGKNDDDLHWIVGNAGCFNEHGSVPTNTTTKDVLRIKDENDWHTGRDMQILAALSALFHDFGKANVFFQNKLKEKQKKADAYRHEWVSLRLFQSFIAECKTDEEWLMKLTCITPDIEQACLTSLIRDGVDPGVLQMPFDKMLPLAQTIGWLILSHHELPTKKIENRNRLENLLENIDPSWNRAQEKASAKEKKECWKFENGLPFSSTSWKNRAKYWAENALARPQLFQRDWLRHDIYTLHLTRLCLMLADHYYSSEPANALLGDAGCRLYANTDTKTRAPKQRLDEHLLGVEKNASKIARSLPLLAHSLPRIARHKGFTKRSASPYQWQDKAYDLAYSIRSRTDEQGFFGVNMASTGTGKTFANGRIMYGLAEPRRGARFTIALGLRTLTLQTGEAYRSRLHLGADDLGVLVGSSAVKDLFNLENDQIEDQLCDENGSDSAKAFFSDSDFVHFEGTMGTGAIDCCFATDKHAKKLLSAPILVCTIDHLIGATERLRGGKQITPMLRLMTSDLILDEPDDFNIEDLPALTRLVHWAGMLGSKVLLSSATLPPSLVSGLFSAYLEGRKSFQNSRGHPGKPLQVCCAWFDEYESIASEHTCGDDFFQAHKTFVEGRVKKIEQIEVRRQAIIKPLTASHPHPQTVRAEVALSIHHLLHELHENNYDIDSKTSKRISIGLIRFANIDPLIDVASELISLGAKDNHFIRICCYHSRHPLLIRSHIEKMLDRLLQRHKPEAIFKDIEFRKDIDSCSEENVIFVVLATAVAEVGRDHDYDWAIVEPSSMRSIIQLAGRIKRHRKHICKFPNIYLLGTNIRSLEKQKSTPTYCWPGFEKENCQLTSHQLEDILRLDQYEKVNAIPRISTPEITREMATKNLVDLEHYRLHALMLSKEPSTDCWPVNLWWTTDLHLSGVFQKLTQFRKDPFKKVRFALLPDEDNEDLEPKFNDLEGDTPKPDNNKFKRLNLMWGKRIQPWGSQDYLSELRSLAESLDYKDLSICALRFGWIDLPQENDSSSWHYQSTLGIRREKRD